jgi:hypothetical protein
MEKFFFSGEVLWCEKRRRDRPNNKTKIGFGFRRIPWYMWIWMADGIRKFYIIANIVREHNGFGYHEHLRIEERTDNGLYYFQLDGVKEWAVTLEETRSEKVEQ